MKSDAKIVLLMTSLLVMIGIVMIYSSSSVYAYGNYDDSLYFVKKHLVYLMIGLIAGIFCMSVSAKALEENARIVMLASVMLLLIVLVPGIGSQAGGARRWIRFAGLGFQPSELAKLVLIIYLADLTSRKRFLMQNFRYGLVPSLFIIGLTGGLILLEPDLGTSVSVLFVGLVMLFASGVKMKHLASITAAVLPFMIFVVISAPYRLKRVMTFFNPWADARGAGFQLIQSFIALGSGGFFGVGLGASKQKLFYLPESHTDFIFSIIGEELGFFGTAFVLMVFSSLIWFLLRIAFRIRRVFASRVVLGVTLMIAFEVIVNIGVSTGTLPTKGLPLPFISYGGSSLVCHLAAIGIVLNMAREEE